MGQERAGVKWRLANTREKYKRRKAYGYYNEGLFADAVW